MKKGNLHVIAARTEEKDTLNRCGLKKEILFSLPFLSNGANIQSFNHSKLSFTYLDRVSHGRSVNVLIINYSKQVTW